MPDFRSFSSKEKTLKMPKIDELTSEWEVNSKRFINRIFWNYKDKNLSGFYVFKAVLDKPILENEYNISQAALERLTPSLYPSAINTILYNKSRFSKSSKLNFFQSNSEKFDKKEKKISRYNFKQIGFVRRNKLGQYSFEDRNIKFGEVYLYSLVAVGRSFKQSRSSSPVKVNIENVLHPKNPQLFKADILKGGILLTINGDNDDSVVSFDLYKREKDKGQFVFLDRVEKNQKKSSINYWDFSIFPGKKYEYKAYSVNYLNNASLGFVKVESSNDEFLKRGSISIPKFSIINDGGDIVFKGIKNDDRIIGYKLERQDVWRFEDGFTVKTNNGISWPSVNLFNEDDVSELIDKSVENGRIYKYRVSSIRKDGTRGSFYTTPHLKIGEENFSNIEEFESSDVDFKINSFSVSRLNKKQSKPILKAEWNFTGNWDNMSIQIGPMNFSVGNIHTKAYLEADRKHKGKSFKASVIIYDVDGNILKKRNGGTIKI